MIRQLSDNEIYLLIKYIKSVLWRVAKCLSYIEEARCIKVNTLRTVPAQLIQNNSATLTTLVHWSL